MPNVSTTMRCGLLSAGRVGKQDEAEQNRVFNCSSSWDPWSSTYLATECSVEEATHAIELTEWSVDCTAHRMLCGLNHASYLGVSAQASQQMHDPSYGCMQSNRYESNTEL